MAQRLQLGVGTALTDGAQELPEVHVESYLEVTRGWCARLVRPDLRAFLEPFYRVSGKAGRPSGANWYRLRDPGLYEAESFIRLQRIARRVLFELTDARRIVVILATTESSTSPMRAAIVRWFDARAHEGAALGVSQ